ncbi:unnamed protein product [Gadus morhua 'NCC']
MMDGDTSPCTRETCPISGEYISNRRHCCAFPPQGTRQHLPPPCWRQGAETHGAVNSRETPASGPGLAPGSAVDGAGGGGGGGGVVYLLLFVWNNGPVSFVFSLFPVQPVSFVFSLFPVQPVSFVFSLFPVQPVSFVFSLFPVQPVSFVFSLFPVQPVSFLSSLFPSCSACFLRVQPVSFVSSRFLPVQHVSFLSSLFLSCPACFLSSLFPGLPPDPGLSTTRSPEMGLGSGVFLSQFDAVSAWVSSVYTAMFDLRSLGGGGGVKVRGRTRGA